MATAIFMMILLYLSFVIIPWVAHVNHGTMHKIDLMAGGEGID